MSKRAEQALESIHNHALLEAEKYMTSHGGSIVEEIAFGRGSKAGFIKGYEQAEKDAIERACEYLFKHYAVNLDEFRKAMEEDQ